MESGSRIKLPYAGQPQSPQSIVSSPEYTSKAFKLTPQVALERYTFKDLLLETEIGALALGASFLALS